MSKKRNQQNRPRVEDQAGKVEFNVADYDGRMLIGGPPLQFDTKWDAQLRFYNDPSGIAGVAVMHDAPPLHDLTISDVDVLNFTSRVRQADVGSVAVFENDEGNYLAARVTSMVVSSREQAVLSITYRTIENDGLYSIHEPLPDIAFDYDDTDDEDELADEDGAMVQAKATLRLEPWSRDFFELYEPFDAAAVSALAEEMKERFRTLVEMTNNADAPAHGGSGHNNPPPEIVIDPTVRELGLEALDTISRPREQAPDALAGAITFLSNAAIEIGRWSLAKLDKVADGLAEEAGAILARSAPVALGWYLFSGDLQKLISMLAKILGQ